MSAATVPALALEVPDAGRLDQRIRFVNYNSSEVVKIIGRARASTQIMFAESEHIAHVAIGDSVAWEVAPAQNILFLKPREQHPPTNLQVVTTQANGARRNYIFELRATEGDVSSGNGHFFAVKFRYPHDEAERARQHRRAEQAKAESGLIDQTLDVHDAFARRNWAYSAQGSRSLQPDSIYDNGRNTVMRFDGNRPVPAVYMVREDGSESLVPHDVRDAGRVVVLHATAREFRLRAGDDVLCIFNENRDPVGVNYGTGTTSPSIERRPR